MHDEYQNYEIGRSVGVHQQFVAEVTDIVDGRLILRAKNQFARGDSLQLMTPAGNHDFVLEDVRLLKNGHDMDVVPGSDYEVSIALDMPNLYDAKDFGLIMKNL